MLMLTNSYTFYRANEHSRSRHSYSLMGSQCNAMHIMYLPMHVCYALHSISNTQVGTRTKAVKNLNKTK